MMNTADHPTIYPLPTANKLLMGAAALACALVVYMLSGLMLASTDKGERPFLLLGTITALILMAVSIAAISKVKTTLHRERLTQAGIFTVKELQRRDIKGYRMRKVKNTVYFDLFPRDGQLRKMTVTQAIFKDAVFSAWMRGIPDLCAQEQQSVDLAIARDASLGATPEERKEKVRRLHRAAKYLSFGYLAAAGLMGLYPHPIHLVMTMTLIAPWIAIGMVYRSEGNFTIAETDRVVLLRKASLLQLILLPALPIYFIFTNAGVGMPHFPLKWGPPLFPAIMGGLIMTWLVWRTARGARVKSPILLLIFSAMTMYAGGSLCMLNSVFDHHDSSDYRLTVLGKHRISGKGAADFFNVTSTDASYDGETMIRVHHDMYVATEVNASVCAHIHPGTFGWRWESIDSCDQVDEGG